MELREAERWLAPILAYDPMVAAKVELVAA
jgi:hypothetical protein